MRLLADLHVSPSTVSFLRNLGHDIVRVDAVLANTASDEEIVEAARAELRLDHRVHVVEHGAVVAWVDEDADVEMALAIAENAKCQRPGVCNAMETLLVDKAVAEPFLSSIAAALAGEGVELRGDDEARKLVPDMKAADESDWYEEYLDLVSAVRETISIPLAVKVGPYRTMGICSAATECRKLSYIR